MGICKRWFLAEVRDRAGFNAQFCGWKPAFSILLLFVLFSQFHILYVLVLYTYVFQLENTAEHCTWRIGCFRSSRKGWVKAFDFVLSITVLILHAFQVWLSSFFSLKPLFSLQWSSLNRLTYSICRYHRLENLNPQKFALSPPPPIFLMLFLHIGPSCSQHMVWVCGYSLYAAL